MCHVCIPKIQLLASIGFGSIGKIGHECNVYKVIQFTKTIYEQPPVHIVKIINILSACLQILHFGSTITKFDLFMVYLKQMEKIMSWKQKKN